MLTGLALRTIYNCVFTVEKTKLKMRPLESTHHVFFTQREVTCSHGWREGRERQGWRDAVQRELPFAKSVRVGFLLNADCTLCHGWLDLLSFNYGI